jgi:pimeloyl-ACP methyl ester carboxylesterase/DNA-binding CsgD family transcriptional regulator
MDASSVQYATTSDGYKIAYAVTGSGPTLVYMPFSIQSLGHAADPAAAWGQNPQLARLAPHVRLVRYDTRGQGLSTRGLKDDHSLAAYVRDLEAVLDHLPGQAVLMGGALSSHVAVHYAVRHPGRVRALVLYRTSITLDLPAVFNRGLAESDWDLFLHSLLGVVQANERISPDERRKAVTDMKDSVDQSDWLQYARVAEASNIQDLLPQVRVPTMVMATGGHLTIPREAASRVASLLPDVHFVLLDGAANLGATATPVLDFLAGLPDEPSATGISTGLSKREIQVLQLVARGLSNQQIADELVITRNTVRRHVSNVFDKAAVANRAQAALYARDHGLA